MILGHDSEDDSGRRSAEAAPGPLLSPESRFSCFLILPHPRIMFIIMSRTAPRQWARLTFSDVVVKMGNGHDSMAVLDPRIAAESLA